MIDRQRLRLLVDKAKLEDQWAEVSEEISRISKQFRAYASDKLAHESVTLALKATRQSSQGENQVIWNVFWTIKELVKCILGSEDGNKITSLWVPALVGLLKSVSQVTCFENQIMVALETMNEQIPFESKIIEKLTLFNCSKFRKNMGRLCIWHSKKDEPFPVGFMKKSFLKFIRNNLTGLLTNCCFLEGFQLLKTKVIHVEPLDLNLDLFQERNELLCQIYTLCCLFEQKSLDYVLNCEDKFALECFSILIKQKKITVRVDHLLDSKYVVDSYSNLILQGLPLYPLIMQATKSQDKQIVLNCCSIVKLVSCQRMDQETISTATSFLMQQSKVFNECLGWLSDIALVADLNVFTEILCFLSSRNDINALNKLSQCEGLKRQTMLIQIMELFQTNVFNNHTANLGALLKLITKLQNQSVDNLFRNIWYLILKLDLCSNQEMQDTIIDFAGVTPVLPFASVIENHFLCDLKLSILTTELQLEESMYLVTLYHVCCYKASDSKLELAPLFEHMVQYKQMFPSFLNIVESILQQFYVVKCPNLDHLEFITLQLIQLTSNYHPQISRLSSQMLLKILDAHPCVFMVKKIFFLFLDVIVCNDHQETNHKSDFDMCLYLQKVLSKKNSTFVVLAALYYLKSPISLRNFMELQDSFAETLKNINLGYEMAKYDLDLNKLDIIPRIFVQSVFYIEQKDLNLLISLVELVFCKFEPKVVRAARTAFMMILLQCPESHNSLMILVEQHILKLSTGLFSKQAQSTPFDIQKTNKEFLRDLESFEAFLEFLSDVVSTSHTLSSSFIRIASLISKQMNHHSESRITRFLLLNFCLKISNHSSCPNLESKNIKQQVVIMALEWFSYAPSWTSRTDFLPCLNEFYKQFPQDNLLKVLLNNEAERLQSWTMMEPNSMDIFNIFPINWKTLVQLAWQSNPRIAIYMTQRFTSFNSLIQPEVQYWMQKSITHDLFSCPISVFYLLTPQNLETDAEELRYLTYFDPLPPVQAVLLFHPRFKSHPLCLQYALRSLYSHPINNVFFYIPQIVQALRHDVHGYVEEYILHAAQTSTVFSHLIIWNMKANMYRDSESSDADDLKPKFDKIMQTIIDSYTEEGLLFYKKEFDFFQKITSISGKLKPYIKKPKSERKQKIDEELALVKVQKGCYLPSNPESTVLEIDYKSGKPLQSHAKAPFLASFFIERKNNGVVEQVKQSAIFKVGDDCRQDVLALQEISLMKQIYESDDLDLYLFPYRVVATDPGCGVIEVIPDAISRDMLGREKINSMFEYFVAKYGHPHTKEFQNAQKNFISSVAAYSVCLYILQIKDRHNGNIMLDDQGHILHIDFGFILDIAPGPVEKAPFKLTSEMLQIIGTEGSKSFLTFKKLVVQGFLAVRPYAEEIVSIVQLMDQSGLPCFRGESTLKKLRSRFALDKSEREAVKFMCDKIHASYQSLYTYSYDYFQSLTNGIPY